MNNLKVRSENNNLDIKQSEDDLNKINEKIET